MSTFNLACNLLACMGVAISAKFGKNEKNTHNSLRKKGQNENVEKANAEIILEKNKEILY